MGIDNKIKIVTQLQITSRAVFRNVLKLLSIGMSEFEISEMIRSEYQKKGVNDYWYDAPRNVLIGTERFKIGTTTSDYNIKNPSKSVLLEEGSVLFIDLHPIDSSTKMWGDLANILVFKPRPSEDNQQIEFLKEFREIHRQGISQITAKTTGTQVANFYLDIFRENGIKLLDVRNNVGHSIHSGPKTNAKRIWLDLENNNPLGEGIFTVEPGGYQKKKEGKGIVVARFEECIYYLYSSKRQCDNTWEYQ